MDETIEYEWTDNPTVSGESVCDTDVLNECLMHLKYNNGNGDALPLFTTMAFDRILTGEEAIGWALQGSLVTNTYPDAVAQIKSEYENAEETLNYSKTTPITMPVFTSNTAGNITVSDARENTDAYKLINGVSSKQIGDWSTYWFNIDYGENTLIKSYNIKADSTTNPEYPSDWTLQGSSDGAQWDVLDTRNGQTFTLGQSRTFIVTTEIPYKQYRLVFSNGVEASGNGELAQIGFNVESIVYSFSYKKAQNGHYIADIADKTQIDVYFSETGIADFYVLDSVNNQFYLPKNNWFYQFTSDSNAVNSYNESGLPNIKGYFSLMPYQDTLYDSGGAFTSSGDHESRGIRGLNNGFTTNWRAEFDASLSNSVYGNSDKVQPPSSNKLLYYKVGSTIVNESEIDVANLTSDVQAVQASLDNKLNKDLSNISVDLSSFSEPDYNAGISKTLNSDNTAEASGVVYAAAASQQYGIVGQLKINNNTVGRIIAGDTAGYASSAYAIVAKGDIYRYDTGGSNSPVLMFYPYKGAIND